MADYYVQGFNNSGVPTAAKILSGASVEDIRATVAPGDDDLGGSTYFNVIALSSTENNLRGGATVTQLASVIAALTTDGVKLGANAKALTLKAIDNTFSGSAYSAVSAQTSPLKVKFRSLVLRNLNDTTDTVLTVKSGTTVIDTIYLPAKGVYRDSEIDRDILVGGAAEAITIESSANVRITGRIHWHAEA